MGRALAVRPDRPDGARHEAARRRAPCALRQEGTDLVVELGESGLELCADIKLELFCDRQRLAVLADAAEDLPPSAVGGGGGGGGGGGNAAAARLDRLRQEHAHGGVNQDLRLEPTAGAALPGADRQLVLYTWFHTALEQPDAPVIETSPRMLDKGKEVKPLVKRLLQRSVTLLIELGDGAAADGGAGRRRAGLAAKPSSSAALERARKAAAAAPRL